MPAIALCLWASALALACLPAAPVRADEELEFGLEERALHRVVFEGNQAYDDDRLRELLAVGRTHWYNPFDSSTYRTDRLQQGIDAIRAWYRRQGYHDATVELVRIEEDPVRGDEILIRVHEGRRTLIGAVEIVDPAPLEASSLRPLLRFRAGGPAPARRADLGGDLYRLLDHYVARGFLGATVREEVIPADSLVTIRYTIRAGPVYRIRDIEVRGAQETRTEHIRRELRLRPGDRFDTQRVALTEADLLETGWFRDVSFEPARLDTTQALADLVVRVSERRTGFYEAGVGFGDREEWRLSAAWGDRNLWRTGRSLTLRARLLAVVEDRFDASDGDGPYYDTEVELLYRSPRVFGTRFDLNLTGFFREESRPQSGVELERTGVLANTELYSGRYTTLELEFGIERILKFPLDGTVAGDFFPNRRAQTRSLTTFLERDTRNDLFDPRRGDLRQLLLQTAGGPLLGGDNAFNKVLGSWVHFVPLPHDATFGLRAQAGWAQAWWDSRDDGVPLEDRFFAGGNRTVRGYAENSLGPRATESDFEEVLDDRFLANRPTTGGSALLLLNAELRFGLPWLSRWGFGGAVFVDGGNVWTSWDRVSLEHFRPSSEPQGEDPTTVLDFRTSYGFGLHYRTIVGPLRLEYGIPLKRAAFEDEGGVERIEPDHVWHFSLGHAF